jgi:cbb3-type cytochrome oxidase subunit 3
VSGTWMTTNFNLSKWLQDMALFFILIIIFIIVIAAIVLQFRKKGKRR